LKAEGNNSLQLTFDAFKKCLVRVAVLAQDQIGGQREDLLGQRLEKVIEEKEEEARKKDRLKRNAQSKERKLNKAHEELKSQFESEKNKIIKTGTIEGNKIY
jgi:hypothetical protein